MKTKKWIFIAFLLLLVLLIRIVSSSAPLAEQHYSTGIYPYISDFFRYTIGWLPFSVGDILYAFTVSWLLYSLTRIVQLLWTRNITRAYLVKKFQSALLFFLITYVAFNVLWGINYNREGITKQLGLQVGQYSTQDLLELNRLLLKKVNENKTAITRHSRFDFTEPELYERAQKAYALAHKKFPFLQYQTSSIKSSLWGWMGSYVGFAGYYNPFTGEAQVNTSIPSFLQPFTACHEIAHQLGYAKENEANFVGYLSATSSQDSLFLYSTYLDLFLYAERNLYTVDSVAAHSMVKQLLPSVRQDLKEWSDFHIRHRNFVEPFIRWLYDKFLQNNEQPAGVLTYDEVTGFLIAYHKKFGEL